MTSCTIETGGRGIRVTRAGKVLFPDCGVTKGDLAWYWARIARTALPHYRDRALTMERYPDGVDGKGFFQKNIPDSFPDWIGREELQKQDGTVTHIVVGDAATLVYLAEQGMITPHLALSRVDSIDWPDRLVLDLDPPGDDFSEVQRAGRRVRGLLDEIGARSFVQTTGSRGLHVVLSLDRSAGFDATRDLAQRLARHLAKRHPDEVTVEQRKARRGNRVFIDTLRNAYGQTSAAPYAVRARPTAPVATPLDWDEALAGPLGPRDYTIRNVFRRLGQKDDPWATIDDEPNAVETLARRLSEIGG